MANRKELTQKRADSLRDVLYDLYWVQKLTHNEIAEKLRCSPATVHRLLNRCDIRSCVPAEFLSLYKDKRRLSFSRSMKGRPHSSEHNRKVWETLKNNPGHPFFKSQGRFKNIPGAARAAALISNAKRWSNPEISGPIVAKILRAINIRPNKAELHLERILNDNFPNSWKYVGDGEFIIGGKNPDFININGKKQIIELFGTHWHNLFDVAKRTETFRQYGFNTLIIWEDELNNEEAIVKRIKSFTRSRK
jgi:very-short-patch-repair endonuclease/predicted DNA-binding protein YlxM (UPF0122 family)